MKKRKPIISIDVEKSLIKFNSKVEIKRNFLNLLKRMYQKPIAIIISEKPLEAFLLYSGTSQRWLWFLLLVDIILEVLANQKAKVYN